MTQKELIIRYISEFGSIIPAKMTGKIFYGVMFGSETSKRCRELRKKGILTSKQEGKFERFFAWQPKVILPPAFTFKEKSPQESLF